MTARSHGARGLLAAALLLIAACAPAAPPRYLCLPAMTQTGVHVLLCQPLAPGTSSTGLKSGDSNVPPPTEVDGSL